LSVNVAFRAWVWAQKKRSPLTGPQVQFLSTSYAQHLSVRDNVKARRLIDSPWYQRGWGDRFRLTSDQNTKIRFENDQGGAMLASSVDGTATGDGGDIIIIDDAISRGRRALADDPRLDERMVRRHHVVAPERSENRRSTSSLCSGSTRTTSSGHVLRKEEAEERGWTVLCLPARYEPDHPFVYAPKPAADPKYGGEGMTAIRAKLGDGTLWPDRMGEKEIRKLEVGMGSYAAAGQLQQRPAPREGGMFKRAWFEVVDAAPARDLDEVRAWDLAGTVPKPGCDPDYTSGTKMGRARRRVFLHRRYQPRPGSPAQGRES
jgi:hypothetical protein